MTIVLSVLLSLSLILPADGRRFEWVRAMHQTGKVPGTILLSRAATVLIMAALLAVANSAWAGAATLGRHMLVFAGVMAAAWLWMWFWMRTYVADPDQPVLVLGPAAVILGSLLSFTQWLSLFTLQALVAAWMTDVTWVRLWGLSVIWVALDALWLATLGRHRAGYRHIQSERQQRRVSRSGGSLVMLVAIWALVVVFSAEG